MNPQVRNRLLVLLHRYNGWNTLYLLITGVVLYLPPLRRVTAPFRVPLKETHILSGILMVVLLLAYLPLLSGHWQRLAQRLGQQLNVLLLVTAVAGWTATGVVLWLHRDFPPAWAAVSLLWHDYLTWLLVPWIVTHSVTRYYKVKLPLVHLLDQRRPPRTVDAERRALLTNLGISAAAAVWGVAGFRTLASGGSDGFVPDAPVATPGPGQPAGAVARVAAAIPPGFDQSHAEITPAPTTQAPTTTPVAPAASPAPSQPAPAAAPIVALLQTARAGGPPLLTAGNPPMPVATKLPPVGGGLKGRFRIYTVTDNMPAFHPDTWRFKALGLIDQPVELTWRDFLSLPRTTQVSDFHCVTGWSVNHITWEGVRLSALLDLLGVKSTADHVKFYSNDGAYTDDLPMDVARASDVMLAYLIDGAPLPAQLGGPVRLIVPRMYGYKSVKWLGALELIQGPYTGYWEERGYDRIAWVKA